MEQKSTYCGSCTFPAAGTVGTASPLGGCFISGHFEEGAYLFIPDGQDTDEPEGYIVDGERDLRFA